MKAARFSRRSRGWLMDVQDRHTVPPMRRERVAIPYVRIRPPPSKAILCAEVGMLYLDTEPLNQYRMCGSTASSS